MLPTFSQFRHQETSTCDEPMRLLQTTNAATHIPNSSLATKSAVMVVSVNSADLHSAMSTASLAEIEAESHEAEAASSKNPLSRV